VTLCDDCFLQGVIGTDKDDDQHGAMRGTVTFLPGVELTGPTG
jgi:hypothetical protein